MYYAKDCKNVDFATKLKCMKFCKYSFFSVTKFRESHNLTDVRGLLGSDIIGSK